MTNQARVLHRFNHDLLMSPQDRDAALLRWPSAARMLSEHGLTSTFREHEREAKVYRRFVQWSGTVSVVLAIGSLAGVAAELAGNIWAMSHGSYFALGAMASLLFAFLASRYWRWRRHWLVSRFVTEIIRRQRFQVLFNGEEDRSLDQTEASVKHLIENAAYARMLSFREGAPLGESNQTRRLPNDPAIRREVLEAYFALRLQHQLDYATYKTSDIDRSFLGLSGHALVTITDQLAGISLGGALVLALAAALHWPSGRWVVAGTLGLTLTGVALRAWRDGMALAEDHHRYGQYRQRLTALRLEWLDSSSDEQRLHVCNAVEHTAEEELRSFIETHSSAQFVM